MRNRQSIVGQRSGSAGSSPSDSSTPVRTGRHGPGTGARARRADAACGAVLRARHASHRRRLSARLLPVSAAAPRRTKTSASQALARISRAQSKALRALRFAPPVTHVYDPFTYARAPWEQYLERYAAGPKESVLLGMNPGPFGMAQTGVPFGDVAMVRDFLGITGAVTGPDVVHPARPVLGFGCKRSEVSGTRLWGWIRERFGTAEAFFARGFVLNWCPLIFLEESGKNRTPDALPKHERAPLEAACDAALRASVEVLAPRLVIGVGQFAEKRARLALAGLELAIASIPHPSPASPLANRGWSALADQGLDALGVERSPATAR